MDRGPLRSEAQSSYEFSDEMKRELSTRDTTHVMKMDDFKSYTTELVKWQTMEKQMKAAVAGK